MPKFRKGRKAVPAAMNHATPYVGEGKKRKDKEKEREKKRSISS
jgi:hypothetical protein